MIGALLALAAVQVGSKQFTESVILGEATTQTLAASGVAAKHRRELGGTRVLWEALRKGEIDVYPEYTGTIAEELLPGAGQGESLRAALGAAGVQMGAPLGFDDSYAIGLSRALSDKLSLRTLSQLAAHPELPLAFSNEFLRRKDGWPRLREVYGFGDAGVRGMDHQLAYRAVRAGEVAATDLYSTDAELRAGDVVVLQDDRQAFPRYQAVLLWRSGLPAEAVRALRRLEGAIAQPQMVAMNARAQLDHEPEALVAAAFLQAKLGVANSTVAEGRAARLWHRTLEHLFLVAVSLAAAIALAVPLGIAAYRRPRLGRLLLGATSVVQTIPSLALLVFMIPLFGIGAGPAIVALFLYSLLPIARGAHSGLQSIPPELTESARALGLPRWPVLRLIELPLASRAILAGIKTAAVIDVGTATLGALIGAGGYGQPILTGVRLADTSLLLEGAVPAALLALAVEAGFDLLGRVVVPRGLRLRG